MNNPHFTILVPLLLLPLLQSVQSVLQCNLQPHLHQEELGFSGARLRQAVLERDLSLRTGLSCLQGQPRVFSLLDKLKAASLLRLELSQTIQDSLRS